MSDVEFLGHQRQPSLPSRIRPPDANHRVEAKGDMFISFFVDRLVLVLQNHGCSFSQPQVMRDEQHSGIIGLVMVAALVGYLGTYFLAADYMDFGSNTPMYLLRYRVGSVSLQVFAPFFEPARRLDDLCLRRRNGTVMEWRTP